MIRPATHEDIPTVAKLGALFHQEAGLGDIADYRPEDTANTLGFMVDNEAAILLVAEEDGEIVGMVGALAFPAYFNGGHKMAQEMFWFVKPDSRNGVGRQLIDGLEQTAAEMGCDSLIMIALDRVNPEAVGKYYRHRGYRPSEHSYIRRL